MAISGQRRHVLRAGLFFMGHQTGEALVPVVAGLTIDRALATGDTMSLVRWLIILGAVFATLSFSWRYGARANVRAVQGAAHELRIALARRVLDARGGADRGRLPGELLSIATADALQAASITTVVARAAALLAAFTVATVALLAASLPLGLLVLLGTPPLLVVLHLLSRPLERRSGAEQAAAARATGLAADLVQGLRILKGIGAEDAASQRYTTASRGALRSTLHAANARAGFNGVTVLGTGLFLALVALVGGRLAAEGDISVGDLIAAVGLAQFLLGPLEALGNLGAQYAAARASARRVGNVLEAPPAVRDGDASLPAPLRGELEFRRLSHRSLHNLSLRVPAGELLGIVAADLHDARSLLETLAREADFETGEVLLDGVPLMGLTSEAVHGAVLVAAHDAALFSGTVLENVWLDEGTSHDESILAAAAADEVLASVASGEDAAVSEGGRSLSGGQRQRIALARALAADPPVLVLHDPTTAVDSVTEARIANGIRTVRRGKTTILVTTSPALLATCDRVVVIERGAIVLDSTHATLLDEDAYREVVLA